MSKTSRIIIIFMFFLRFVYAQEIRIDPENFWIQTKEWDAYLTSSLLIESSLAASGLFSEDLDLYVLKYRKLLLRFENDRKAFFSTLTTYEQGEFILTWAHNNILKDYIEEQTLMDVLIDTGNYNCVSSAILYLILSKEAGLSTETIETSDHAFCTVKTDEGWIDVETTTSYGFNPGVKQEFQQAFNQTGYTYVPPGNYRERKRITDKAAAALIIQNRMSVLQKDSAHDQAVGLSIDRWIFANTDNNYNEMNDSFRNWSAVLNNRGSYLDAYNFLLTVSEKYDLLDENKNILFDLAYNQIITLTNSDKYDLANKYLLKTKLILNIQDQIKLEKLVVRDYLADVVRNKRYDESLPMVREAYTSNKISKSEWQNWITVLHQNEALLISQNTGWWDAWIFMKSLPLEERNIRSIKTSTAKAHDNWSFGIHNQFADLYNNQNFEEAEKILMEALKMDPENKYLSKDLANLKRLMP